MNSTTVSSRANNAAPSTPTYNSIFSKLVTDRDSDLVGFLAYGLYKLSKQEWIVEYTANHGHPPSQAECVDFASHQSETILSAFRSKAEETINEFANTILDAERPAIERDALKGKFLRDFWPAFTGALALTILLAMVTAIAAMLGVGLPIEINVQHNKPPITTSAVPNEG